MSFLFVDDMFLAIAFLVENDRHPPERNGDETEWEII